MLTLLDNFAVVQIIQFLILCFFILLSVAVVSSRLHLPQTKLATLFDVIMVEIIFIYALTLKIYFST